MSSTVSLTRSKEQDARRLLGVLALTIAGLGGMKFGALMAEWVQRTRHGSSCWSWLSPSSSEGGSWSRTDGPARS